MRFLYFFIITLFASNPVFAEQWVSLDLKTGIQFFEYKEFSRDKEALNTERGFMPGLELGIYFPQTFIQQRFTASYYGASVDYDGQTQAGSSLQTETESELYRASYELSVPLCKSALNSFVSVNLDRWNRSIQPSSRALGLDEVYQWPSLHAGFSYQISQSGLNRFTLRAAYIEIFEGEFEVDLSQIGFSKIKTDLGKGNGVEATLSYRYGISEKVNLGVDVFYREWDFARSSEISISNGLRKIKFAEPESRSKRTGAALNFSYLL